MARFVRLEFNCIQEYNQIKKPLYLSGSIAAEASELSESPKDRIIKPMIRKRILMIATGGTIASLDAGNGLTPELKSKELLHYVPEVSQYCDTETIQLMNLDSTDVTPGHWLEISSTIEKHYRRQFQVLCKPKKLI